jgi:glyoxylase-like metal-dependent hydrolase (beta-lactamase superfamily II)
MKPLYRNVFLSAALAVVLGVVGSAIATAPPDTLASNPELQLLKQINAWRPPADSQVMFALMGQFSNSGRYAEGIAYFGELLARFGPKLNNDERAQYLTAIAALRAGQANDIFLLKRFGWVKDTLAMLDEAKRLTGGQMYIARWMSGVVRAQLPGLLGEGGAAQRDLQWCVDHVDAAPHAGWLREVYFQLSRLNRRQGQGAEARKYLALSGYTREDKVVTLTTALSESRADGHRFAAQTIREVVPGSVYALSGFEFTEYYFIVSADHKQLISIDAGTRPDTARKALEALRARVPGLPALTTVFVTHAHWDHVGGHRYFRSINPAIRFVGRSNYQAELNNDASGNTSPLKSFFGAGFSLDDVLSYRPDERIDKRTEQVIGGTRFVLTPTRGGETGDAMLIQMPETGIVFAGDVFMPYFGAPFVAEGSVDGMLASIDQLVAMAPKTILQGHEPLTRLFSSPRMLAGLKVQLAWLQAQVIREIEGGNERSIIQQKNLVPPALEAEATDVHFAYLILRENLINRLFDQYSGYWQNGLKGMDHISDADRGAVLADYLGVSEARLAEAAKKMIADGHHELAADLIRAWHSRHPGSHALDEVNRLAYLKLMEKYQDFNPFKFIVYGAQIGQATPPMMRP